MKRILFVALLIATAWVSVSTPVTIPDYYITVGQINLDSLTDSSRAVIRVINGDSLFIYFIDEDTCSYIYYTASDSTFRAKPCGKAEFTLGSGGSGEANQSLPFLSFTFDAGVTNVDPGNGEIAYNNGTATSVTELYVDDASVFGPVGVAPGMIVLDTGYILYLQHSSSPVSQTSVYRIDGSADSTGWYVLEVTHISGSTLPNPGDTLSMQIVARDVRTGGGSGTTDTTFVDTTGNTGAPTDTIVNDPYLGESTNMRVTVEGDTVRFALDTNIAVASVTAADSVVTDVVKGSNRITQIRGWQGKTDGDTAIFQFDTAQNAWIVTDSLGDTTVVGSGTGTGDVIAGPLGHTDNEITKWHGTGVTEDSVQGSTSNQPTISDAGLMTVSGGVQMSAADILGADSVDGTGIYSDRVYIGTDGNVLRMPREEGTDGQVLTVEAVPGGPDTTYWSTVGAGSDNDTGVVLGDVGTATVQQKVEWTGVGEDTLRIEDTTTATAGNIYVKSSDTLRIQSDAHLVLGDPTALGAFDVEAMLRLRLNGVGGKYGFDTTATPSDNFIWKFDASDSLWHLEADAGAGGGSSDTTTIVGNDSAISSAGQEIVLKFGTGLTAPNDGENPDTVEVAIDGTVVDTVELNDSLANYLPLAGGTMTDGTSDIDMNTAEITNSSHGRFDSLEIGLRLRTAEVGDEPTSLIWVSDSVHDPDTVKAAIWVPLKYTGFSTAAPGDHRIMYGIYTNVGSEPETDDTMRVIGMEASVVKRGQGHSNRITGVKGQARTENADDFAGSTVEAGYGVYGLGFAKDSTAFDWLIGVTGVSPETANQGAVTHGVGVMALQFNDAGVTNENAFLARPISSGAPGMGARLNYGVYDSANTYHYFGWNARTDKWEVDDTISGTITDIDTTGAAFQAYHANNDATGGSPTLAGIYPLFSSQYFDTLALDSMSVIFSDSASNADTARYLTTVMGGGEWVVLNAATDGFLPSATGTYDVGQAGSLFRDGNFSRTVSVPFLDAESLNTENEINTAFVMQADTLRPDEDGVSTLGGPSLKYGVVYSDSGVFANGAYIERAWFGTSTNDFRMPRTTAAVDGYVLAIDQTATPDTLQWVAPGAGGGTTDTTFAAAPLVVVSNTPNDTIGIDTTLMAAAVGPELTVVGDTSVDAGATVIHPDTMRSEVDITALLGTPAFRWKVVNTDSVDATRTFTDRLTADSIFIGGVWISKFDGNNLTVTAGQLDATGGGGGSLFKRAGNPYVDSVAVQDGGGINWLRTAQTGTEPETLYVELDTATSHYFNPIVERDNLVRDAIRDTVGVSGMNLTAPVINTSIDLPANAVNTATEISADIITGTQIIDDLATGIDTITVTNLVEADTIYAEHIVANTQASIAGYSTTSAIETLIEDSLDEYSRPSIQFAFVNPNGLGSNDTLPVFHFDGRIFPSGVTITEVSYTAIGTPADTAILFYSSTAAFGTPVVVDSLLMTSTSGDGPGLDGTTPPADGYLWMHWVGTPGFTGRIGVQVFYTID